MDQIHGGKCLCGNVKIFTTGKPLRVNACHCTFCQKITGSAYLVEPVFKMDQVKIEGPTVSRYVHISDESGQPINIHFCSRCGTNMSMTFGRFPDVHAIFAGAFDNCDWFEVERHMFIRSAAKNSLLPPKVECFEEHRLKPDGSPNTPIIFEVTQIVGPNHSRKNIV